MATHSTVLAWEIPQTEVPGWLQSLELQKPDNLVTKTTATNIFSEIEVPMSPS